MSKKTMSPRVPGAFAVLFLLLIFLGYRFGTPAYDVALDAYGDPSETIGTTGEKDLPLFELEAAKSDRLSTKSQLAIADALKQPDKNSTNSDAALNPYRQYIKENSDFTGWINIEGTHIDYPIVKGQDNDFYLDRNFNRQKDKYGSIFMDYRNFGIGFDQHTILYGHNMKDHQMFGDLKKYLDIEFLTAHPVIEIQGLYGIKTYRIFSVYYISADPSVIQTAFSGNEFADFIDVISKRSIFQVDLAPGATDNLLTLITCSYDIDDGRYVVHAVETDSQ